MGWQHVEQQQWRPAYWRPPDGSLVEAAGQRCHHPRSPQPVMCSDCGFTIIVQEAGIPIKLASSIGVAVDHRRRNRSLEGLQVLKRHDQCHIAAYINVHASGRRHAAPLCLRLCRLPTPCMLCPCCS